MKRVDITFDYREDEMLQWCEKLDPSAWKVLRARENLGDFEVVEYCMIDFSEELDYFAFCFKFNVK